MAKCRDSRPVVLGNWGEVRGYWAWPGRHWGKTQRGYVIWDTGPGGLGLRAEPQVILCLARVATDEQEDGEEEEEKGMFAQHLDPNLADGKKQIARCCAFFLRMNGTLPGQCHFW